MNRSKLTVKEIAILMRRRTSGVARSATAEELAEMAEQGVSVQSVHMARLGKYNLDDIAVWNPAWALRLGREMLPDEILVICARRSPESARHAADRLPDYVLAPAERVAQRRGEEEAAYLIANRDLWPCGICGPDPYEGNQARSLAARYGDLEPYVFQHLQKGGVL